MTISLQVQPHVLADFLDRDRGMSRGSGFLARFLVSQPMSLQGRRLYKEPGDMPELGAFIARIGEMLKDFPTIDPERGLMLPILDFTPEPRPIGSRSTTRLKASYPAAVTSRRSATLLQRRPTTSPGWLPCCTFSSTAPRADRPPGGRRARRRIVLWHTYSARALLAPFTLSRETANAATLDRWLIDRCQMEGVERFSDACCAERGAPTARARGRTSTRR